MYDQEDWAVIDEFPTYSVSTLGQIRNDATGRILRPSFTRRGALKVGLVRDGDQYTRSIKVLVANAFVPGRTEIFDTPVNADGDRRNNTVDNIIWRPRWFAVKYSRQFIEDYHNAVRGPIKDVNSGELYRNVREASIANGILFKDLFNGCLSGEPVFPTWQQFEWLH